MKHIVNIFEDRSLQKGSQIDNCQSSWRLVVRDSFSEESYLGQYGDTSFRELLPALLWEQL